MARAPLATRKFAGQSNSACQAAILDYGCFDEIRPSFTQIPASCCLGHPRRRSDRLHDIAERKQFLYLRSASAEAVAAFQREGQTQHRSPTFVCARGRQSASGHSRLGGQSILADAARQLPHLFEGGQPPPREQPGRGLPHDLLDGIRPRLRHALGFRQSATEHPRVRAYAAEGRAESLRHRSHRRPHPHRREPTLGCHGRSFASADRRLASARPADVLHAEPAGLCRREAGQALAVLDALNPPSGRA